MYECTHCGKRFGDPAQLIDHLEWVITFESWTTMS